MYPWESDPENGSDQTPHSAVGGLRIRDFTSMRTSRSRSGSTTRPRTIVTGCASTRGRCLREVARFWASRATYDAKRTPLRHRAPDLGGGVVQRHQERHLHQRFGPSRRCPLLSRPPGSSASGPDPLWERVAKQLYIRLAPGGEHHLRLRPSVPVRNAADFAAARSRCWFLPSLDLQMSPKLRSGDYDYGIRPGAGRACERWQHEHGGASHRGGRVGQLPRMPPPGSPAISAVVPSSRPSTCAPRRPTTTSDTS